ncbi:MAG: L-2-hydroxyglutarate oxidase [Bacteroidia bacterium]|nr:L-2-hydroxyglutarate oxidase [Bacteroidia bacterium]
MNDVVIIGGGIVGLATALKLKQNNPAQKITLIEKEGGVGRHQTGNNSGVIHSGIYYKPGSLKAKNCIEGYHMLLEFCDQNQINYELCGKLIVATDNSELEALNNIYDRGIANGLEGLKFIEKEEIHKYEPHTSGVRALLVPQTGIVSYKEVTAKYAEVFEKSGGIIRLNEAASEIIMNDKSCFIKTDKATYETRLIINCAGLQSDRIAGLTIPNLKVRIIPFRGEYYTLKPEKRYLVKNLIYPVPDPNFPFLGVHFTRRVDGLIEAGPNAVFSFKREGYKRSDFSFSDTLGALAWKGFRKVALKYWKTGIGEFYRSFSKAAFTKALQKLIPEITANDLIPGGAGVRAQACDKDGGLIDDFYIEETKGIIHVLNAPSPAATSSLAIGKHIAELALKQLEVKN